MGLIIHLARSGSLSSPLPPQNMSTASVLPSLASTDRPQGNTTLRPVSGCCLSCPSLPVLYRSCRVPNLVLSLSFPSLLVLSCPVLYTFLFPILFFSTLLSFNLFICMLIFCFFCTLLIIFLTYPFILHTLPICLLPFHTCHKFCAVYISFSFQLLVLPYYASNVVTHYSYAWFPVNVLSFLLPVFRKLPVLAVSSTKQIQRIDSSF